MIHLKKSADGQFYFTVNGYNGKVVVTSETYKRKQSAIKAMNTLNNLFYDIHNESSYGEIPFTDHTKPKKK